MLKRSYLKEFYYVNSKGNRQIHIRISLYIQIQIKKNNKHFSQVFFPN